VPVIVVSAQRDAELQSRIEDAPVMAVLIKPVSRKDLNPAIELAVLRFDQFRRLCDDVADVSQALRDRKVVERAKRLLQRDVGDDEAAAFGRLQQTAGANNCKVADAARMLLEAAAQ
jgi:response regulator NasT